MRCQRKGCDHEALEHSVYCALHRPKTIYETKCSHCGRYEAPEQHRSSRTGRYISKKTCDHEPRMHPRRKNPDKPGKK